jgi:plasmid stability protein
MMCYHHSIMRTTLDLPDDVLSALKALAHKDKRSIGAAAGDLIRRALQTPVQPAPRSPAAVDGFRAFPSRGGIVTETIINQLRDEEE